MMTSALSCSPVGMMSARRGGGGGGSTCWGCIVILIEFLDSCMDRLRATSDADVALNTPPVKWSNPMSAPSQVEHTHWSKGKRAGLRREGGGQEWEEQEGGGEASARVCGVIMRGRGGGGQIWERWRMAVWEQGGLPVRLGKGGGRSEDGGQIFEKGKKRRRGGRKLK